jgi:hypothetical protein
MRSKAIYGLCAIALVAACREQQDAGQTNDLIRSAETRTGAAENISATPSGAPLGEPVSAEQAKTIMHERHEGMEEIGDAMKLVSRELKASNPDLARVRDGAATIARLAPQVSGWFPPGTGQDVGKTGGFRRQARLVPNGGAAIQRGRSGQRPGGDPRRPRRVGQELQGVSRPLS